MASQNVKAFAAVPIYSIANKYMGMLGIQYLDIPPKLSDEKIDKMLELSKELSGHLKMPVKQNFVSRVRAAWSILRHGE